MSTKDRKDREKMLRRNAIIEAAEVVFKKKGYELATIDDIANQAELAKGTIYLYFKSKEEVYAAIVLRGIDLALEMLNEKIEKSQTGLEAFQKFGETFSSYCKDFPDYLEAYSWFHTHEMKSQELTKEPPLLQEVRQRKMNIVHCLEKVIKKGIKDGSIKKEIESDKTANVVAMGMASFIAPPMRMRAKMEKNNNCPIDQLLAHYFALMTLAIRQTKEI